MKKTTHILAAIAAAAFLVTPALAGDDMPDGAKLFKKKCKMCHSVNKKKVGPAVMNMPRDIAVLTSSITDGKGRMPKFGKKLSGDEIDAVIAFVQDTQSKVEE